MVTVQAKIVSDSYDLTSKKINKMEKIDLKKQYSNLYKASAKKPEIVTVPQLKYLMVDGFGDPNSSKMFQDAIEALYSVSYTLKFMYKKREESIDYAVMPLEGLWWTDDMNNFSMENKNNWKWTLMILQPEFITLENIEIAKTNAAKKKKLPLLNSLRFEKMNEELSAQILYIGPYNDEPSTIVMLHNFIKDSGYSLCGKHREIYLSDMRRTAPEKLKTIIRQPIYKQI